jgi:hypothetical protein
MKIENDGLLIYLRLVVLVANSFVAGIGVYVALYSGGLMIFLTGLLMVSSGIGMWFIARAPILPAKNRAVEYWIAVFSVCVCSTLLGILGIVAVVVGRLENSTIVGVQMICYAVLNITYGLLLSRRN